MDENCQIGIHVFFSISHGHISVVASIQYKKCGKTTTRDNSGDVSNIVGLLDICGIDTWKIGLLNYFR